MAAVYFSKTGSNYNWAVNWDIFTTFGTLRDAECMSEETGTIKLETRSWYSTAAAAALKTNVTSSVVKYTEGCNIHMKLDALMQTEIPVTIGTKKGK